MRHLTLAALTAIGLMAASPLLAQTPAPATGGAMQKAAPAPAPAPRRPGDDGRGADGRETGRPDRHQFGHRGPALDAAGHCQGALGSDHQGPPLQGQGRVAQQEDRARERLQRHQGQDHRQAEKLITPGRADPRQPRFADHARPSVAYELSMLTAHRRAPAGASVFCEALSAASARYRPTLRIARSANIPRSRRRLADG